MKKILLRKQTFVYLILSLVFSYQGLAQTNSEVYKNPVFEPILADPTILKAEDGWFYAYGTADNWGDGKGPRLVPILRSKTLTNWEYVRNAFDKKPTWKSEGGIWAPDIAKVGKVYHLYYAYSKWGDPNPGVGVATADNPLGPFSNHKKLFLSDEIGVPNSIDPFFIEENNKKYLFWGSYSDAPNQGTYGVPLSDDGLNVPDFSKKFKVAAGDFEGVMIQKKGQYYYFFGSKENCCDGAESVYHVRVGRSENLEGPYLDKEGRDLKNRGSGTILIQRTDSIAGPGHNAKFFTDDNGDDWFLFHAIDAQNPRVPTGANRRMLMLEKLEWTDGWPTIQGARPHTDLRPAPVFNK